MKSSLKHSKRLLCCVSVPHQTSKRCYATICAMQSYSRSPVSTSGLVQGACACLVGQTAPRAWRHTDRSHSPAAGCYGFTACKAAEGGRKQAQGPPCQGELPFKHIWLPSVLPLLAFQAALLLSRAPCLAPRKLWGTGQEAQGSSVALLWSLTRSCSCFVSHVVACQLPSAVLPAPLRCPLTCSLLSFTFPLQSCQLPFVFLSASLCFPVSFPLLSFTFPLRSCQLPFAFLSASLCFPVSFPLLPVNCPLLS